LRQLPQQLFPLKGVIGDPGVCVSRGATRPGRRAGRAAVAVGPRADDGPSPRPSRRSFSPEYKLGIVAEYEAAPNGEKGAILRREGLYSSHVIEWTRARDAGALDSVADSRRLENRRNRSKGSAESAELERLRARNAKLESQLATTRTALDIMGKAHALLEQLSESAEEKNPRPPAR
jgi:transposase